MLEWRALLAIAAVILCGISANAAEAATDSTLPWLRTSSPTIQKSIELAANILPPAANFDCTNTTVTVYKTSATQADCSVTVPFGQVGKSGITFSGTQEAIPVVPERPFSTLQPIPNQSMLITYTSAPVIGNFLHFYTSIRDKIGNAPQLVNGKWQYTISGAPEISLRDEQNQLLVVNTSAMAFSSNGNWMIVDVPTMGFIRINLATFEMLPFATSLQQVNDYSAQRAQLSISNDGSKVVIKPASYDYFKVVDLSTCSAVRSLPYNHANGKCGFKDYFNAVSTVIPGYRAVYQPRFINNHQIVFTVAYEYTPVSFKVARFTMTAPGESTTGISYLGMGDSYASGEGTYAYIDGTDTSNNKCHLSSRAYALLLSSQIFQSGHAISCSGAVTQDITDSSLSYEGQVADKIKKEDRDSQLINGVLANYIPGFISQSEFVDLHRPDAITISIGGNDIGFADILTRCVSPASLQESCYPTYEDRLELARQINAIFPRLVDTYKQIAKPGKRVYVTGYPLILAVGGNCALNVHFDAHEIQMATDLVEYLNIVIERAAMKAGVRYVDISNAFAGHKMCETKSSDVAVNGFTVGNDVGIGPIKIIGNESYHPNQLGHELLANTIRTATSNLTQDMPTASPDAQAPALPASLDQRNLPRTGRATNTVISDRDVVAGIVLHDQNVNVVLDTAAAALKAFTLYKMVMHSDPVELGTMVSDKDGKLSATVNIPSSIPTGFHTFHIYGPNMLGQPLDIVKTVYVAASEADLDGDGIPNTGDQCQIILASGTDLDKDGTDDACDVLITEAPTPKLSRLTSSATLTDNSITITLTKP